MIDSGRRIGIEASQVTWAKLPGSACVAHFGAATRSTNCPASQPCCEMTRACSRKMVPRWAELIRNRSCAPPRPEDLGQHRHAYGDAVAHLIADHGLRAVGYLGGDLDAAVHRLRMHHDGVGAGQREALRRQSPGGE